jgi:hypothetical protein
MLRTSRTGVRRGILKLIGQRCDPVALISLSGLYNVHFTLNQRDELKAVRHRDWPFFADFQCIVIGVDHNHLGRGQFL